MVTDTAGPGPVFRACGASGRGYVVHAVHRRALILDEPQNLTVAFEDLFAEPVDDHVRRPADQRCIRYGMLIV
jgi:hypothetical protein